MSIESLAPREQLASVSQCNEDLGVVLDCLLED